MYKLAWVPTKQNWRVLEFARTSRSSSELWWDWRNSCKSDIYETTRCSLLTNGFPQWSLHLCSKALSVLYVGVHDVPKAFFNESNVIMYVGLSSLVGATAILGWNVASCVICLLSSRVSWPMTSFSGSDKSSYALFGCEVPQGSGLTWPLCSMKVRSRLTKAWISP